MGHINVIDIILSGKIYIEKWERSKILPFLLKLLPKLIVAVRAWGITTLLKKALSGKIYIENRKGTASYPALVVAAAAYCCSFGINGGAL